MRPSSRSRSARLRPYQIPPQKKRVRLSDGCHYKEYYEARKELGAHQKYSENIRKENKTKKMKIKLWGSGRNLLTKNEGKVMKRGCLGFEKYIPRKLSSKDAEIISQGNYFTVHKEMEMEKEVNFQGSILHVSKEVEMKINCRYQESEDILTREFEVKKMIETQEASDIQFKEIESEMKRLYQESDESNSLENKMKDVGIEQDGIHLKKSYIEDQEEKLEKSTKGLLQDKNECDKKQKENEDGMLLKNYGLEIEIKPQVSRESQWGEGHVKDQGRQHEVCRELVRPEVPEEGAFIGPCVQQFDITAEGSTKLHVPGHESGSDDSEGHPTTVAFSGQIEADVKNSCGESPRLSGLVSKKWEDEMGINYSDSSKENIAASHGGGDDIERDFVELQQNFSHYIGESIAELEGALIKPTKKELVLSETNISSNITENNGDSGEFNEKEIIIENTSTNAFVKSNCIATITLKDHNKFEIKQSHFDSNKNDMECSSIYIKDQILPTKLDIHLEAVELRANDTEIRVDNKNMFVSHTDSVEVSHRKLADDYMECTSTLPTVVKRKSLTVFGVAKDLPQNNSVDEHETEYCMINEKSQTETLPEESFHLKCNMSSVEQMISKECTQKNTACCSMDREGDTDHLTGRRNVHSGQVPLREGDPDPIPMEIQCDRGNVHLREEGDAEHVLSEIECDHDYLHMKREYESDHLPVEEECNLSHIPVGKEGESCHVSPVRDPDHLAVRRENYANHALMSRECEHDPILESQVVDSIDLPVRREGDSDHELVSKEKSNVHVSREGDPGFILVGREGDLDYASLRMNGDLDHVLGGNIGYNTIFVGRDYLQENPLIRGKCEHEGLSCISEVNIHDTVVERMHNNRFSCITYPNVCVINESTVERSRVLEHLGSHAKLDSDRDVETKDRDKLVISGEPVAVIPLQRQENELIEKGFSEENCSLERSFSHIVHTESEQRQAAGKDVTNYYNSGHLISLLQVSGALSDCNHLLSIPRSYLTVELVMAAINLKIFKNNDIFTWICRICRPKTKRYTSRFDHQFQQYQQLYQHITENVCPDKRDVWGDLIKQTVYRIPKGKGVCLIFGKIPELFKNEAVSITLDDHCDWGIQKDMALAPVKCQRGYDACRQSIKAMRSEIDRLVSELKCKNEELRHQQDHTKQEKKIREKDSAKQDLINHFEALTEEIRLSLSLIKTQGSTVNQDVVEVEEPYLKRIPKVVATLRQIVMEKESKMNQLQYKMNSYLDMVKARDIIIKQQQEEICKIECEATQTDAYIKQLEKKIKIAENRIRDWDSHIHQQEEQFRMKSVSVNYVKQFEEDLKLKDMLREQELLICQKQEKLTQVENALMVCESLNNQLNQELKVAQHSLHERDSQIQCHQTLHSQLEYDAQQKEAIAQRLKQELHACEATVSEREAYITKLHAEQSVRSAELEERLVCCNNLLVERQNTIEKLKTDMASSEKKGKENEIHIQNLEEEISQLKNYVLESQAISFSDNSSVTRGFKNIHTGKKFNDAEYSQNYLKDRMAGKKIINDGTFYKLPVDHAQIIRKKDEQLRRVTHRLKELEQALYLSKQERGGNPATDWKSVLELRAQVSELKHCIISREKMNGQLEEMLKNQEESIKKLRNHLEARNTIWNYVQRLCVNSNTVLESFHEDTLSLGKAVKSEAEWLDDLKVDCGFVLQNSSQEISLQHVENVKQEPMHDSVMMEKECSGQTEELEISCSKQVRQKSVVVQSCNLKENTTITVGDVYRPNSIVVQETSSSKRVVSKESHHLKITLSEYRGRRKGKELHLEKEKQKSCLSCSVSQKQNMKRKGNEIGVPETSLLETMKSPHPEKRRRILSRKNLPTELNKIKSIKSQITNTEDFSNTVKDCHATPSIGQTRIRQDEQNCSKQWSKRHDYQAHQSLGERNPGEEIVRLKKTLEYIKGKHDKAMAKEIKERLKLEERSRVREILLAQLVKDYGKLEVQLRNSDTALTIIESDRERIYTLLEQLETDVKQALKTEEYLKDIICQRDDALKLCQNEKAELNLLIEQSKEAHRKKVEDLIHILTVKDIDISGLEKEREKLDEDRNKERENYQKVTEQMKKNLSDKTSALEIIRNEKNQLIEDIEKKDINLKTQMEEKYHIGAMLEDEKLRNNQFEKKLMESEKKLRGSIEEKIEVERLLKGKEQAIVDFEEKTKHMEATLEKKAKELLELQEELCSLKITREKEYAATKTILLEKEKLQDTLKQNAQALREQLDDKEQKETIIQELRETIITEAKNIQMMKMEADETLALKEKEIYVLQKDKEQLEVEIKENKQKHITILSKKDRDLKIQLDEVYNDLKEALEANVNFTSQLEDIKAAKCLIRNELKLGAPSCKTLNFKQELEVVCKLNSMLKEEKQRSGIVNRELLEEKSRNKNLLKQLQILKRERKFEKRRVDKDEKILLNQESQTVTSQEEDMQLYIENTKTLQTALETEKRVSESMYLKFLVEQKKSVCLATGLKQAYEETSKDLEYQLCHFSWAAERYREKMKTLKELTALSDEAGVEEIAP